MGVARLYSEHFPAMPTTWWMLSLLRRFQHPRPRLVCAACTGLALPGLSRSLACRCSTLSMPQCCLCTTDFCRDVAERAAASASQLTPAAHQCTGWPCARWPTADPAWHASQRRYVAACARPQDHRLRSVPALRHKPQKVGLDDWACRRGHVYGTIVVDLQRRRPIELLPDREASTVAAWFAQHAQIRVATRDRAGAYAQAIRQGAPAAVQVADRWHLLKNFGETLERWLSRFGPALRETARQPQEDCAPPPTAKVEPGQIKAKDLASQHRRARRLVGYEDVIRLHAQGMSVSAIARQRQLDRKTARH